ncbi:MAG: hypothetical protein ACO25F_12330, partial [Erythrobacter sp.]
IALAELCERQNRLSHACDQLQELAHLVPSAMPLVAGALARLAPQVQRQIPILTLLQDSYHQLQSLDVLDAIVSLQTSMGQNDGKALYSLHLNHHPSLIAASQLLSDAALTSEQQPQVQRAIAHAAKPLRRYRCAACGFEALPHFWQCPGCQAGPGLWCLRRQGSGIRFIAHSDSSRGHGSTRSPSPNFGVIHHGRYCQAC